VGRWCAAFYDTVMAPVERGGFQAIRKQLLRHARGKVLEIGSGTSVNFPYYTEAKRVIALDPCTWPTKIEFISIKPSAATGSDEPGIMEGIADVPHPIAAAHLS
jgi:hypothetical protein